MPLQTPESFVDVLIIGADPAGLMYGSALAAAGGIEVRIIDQRPSKISVGHADVLHPRTIEVLQLGLAERLLRKGSRMFICTNTSSKFTTRVPDVTVPNACFAFKIAFHQGAIEDAFLDSMAQDNAKADRHVKPLAIELSQDEEQLRSLSSYPIKVTLVRLDAAADAAKLEVIHAKWVVGADGKQPSRVLCLRDCRNGTSPDWAHSWVRKAFGITMEGDQTSNIVWGVIDMVPDTDFPIIRHRASIHSTNGSLMIIPRESDKVRLYVELSGEDFMDSGTGRVSKSKSNPDKIPKHTIRTTYMTSKPLVGDRVFIAKDASQGMNASINDTHNLAWKLTQVLKGWASPSILKTGKPRTSADQDGISHEEFFKCTAGGFTGCMGIHCDPSIIVNAKHHMLPQVFAHAADARPIEICDLLPADSRFKILIFLRSMDEESRLAEINALADELSSSTGFLQTYSMDGQIPSPMFDPATIVAGNKEKFNHLNVRSAFRPHWSKVLLDGTDVTGSEGGGGCKRFGISSESITFVIVRPDGYVGMVAPADAMGDVYEYFASPVTAVHGFDYLASEVSAPP
ncbi:hypothetical protein EV401DRAFT_2060314 [Pisolithus croceorrhizus]|nr:hypothetical protein EV401DRAFT_2060314 [Pisolithus croceorrhizus]